MGVHTGIGKEKMITDKVAYMKKWCAEHKEHIKESRKQYLLIHSEQKKLSDKKYRLEHREHMKKYYLIHQEDIKQRSKNRYLTNYEHIRKLQKEYQKTPKGKEVMRKTKAKRKEFGFISLNKPFLSSASHHINRNYVIYIPKELHERVGHSVSRNYNMKKINKLAFDWLNTNEGGKWIIRNVERKN